MHTEAATKLKHLSEFTIAHPMYVEAFRILHQATEARSLGREDASAILFGESGTGKTTLCNDLMRDYPPPYKSKTPCHSDWIMPVVYCRVPSEATVKALTNRLLETFQVFLGRQSQEALEYHLFTLLKTCQTKLLILDELPHLLRGLTPTAIRTAADWLKNLIDAFEGLVLIAGEPDCEKIIDIRAALSDRFPYRARLKPFTISTEEDLNDFNRLIRAFASEIQNNMGFTAMPHLTGKKEILALFALTNGNLRRLSIILWESCRMALIRNDQTLTVSDFSRTASKINFQGRLTSADPFNLSLSALEKIVYKK
ncbi:TniB family NTP-binding protein [Pseudomonas sp. GZD-209]|uniref:TniB family NTP-binding protein n=1 Tax=Pseudomonas sp. GZD-209 TaxID=3404807 RepID=UPI003BB7D986